MTESRVWTCRIETIDAKHFMIRGRRGIDTCGADESCPAGDKRSSSFGADAGSDHLVILPKPVHGSAKCRCRFEPRVEIQALLSRGLCLASRWGALVPGLDVVRIRCAPRSTGLDDRLRQIQDLCVDTGPRLIACPAASGVTAALSGRSRGHRQR